MLNSIFVQDDSIPSVVKNAATKELPRFLGTEDISILQDSFLQLVSVFGNPNDFKAIVTQSSVARDAAEHDLVASFQKNIELLVQKTWVEKSDETLKEDMMMRISALCANLEKHQYQAALADFLPVLKDVVFLLFGTLAKHDNFLDYAVRIDPDFGFFWFYITTLPDHKDWSLEKCRLAVLLGIYFLANY